jgi:hypothetical protein
MLRNTTNLKSVDWLYFLDNSAYLIYDIICPTVINVT